MTIRPEIASSAVATTAENADITVVGGAGHVGIPLVLALAESGLRVNVNDLNRQTLDTLAAEPHGEAMAQRLAKFRDDVILSKLRLTAMLRDLKEKGARIAGISAPSRASTMVNYVGLDEGLIDYVCEIAGSLKIGKCMPGTAIPVVEEAKLFEDQPDCALIFSWHIADELAPKLRAKGFRGRLITPLPVPREI